MLEYKDKTVKVLALKKFSLFGETNSQIDNTVLVVVVVVVVVLVIAVMEQL